MSGRPDYDAGDLVVCTNDDPCPEYGPSGPERIKGRVYTVAAIKYGVDPETGFGAWGCKVCEVQAVWQNCICYRKLDSMPPEFFTGTVDEPVLVPA